MVGGAHVVNAIPKRVKAETSFTMQRLWRQALWGSAAAAALLVAILTGRTDIGSQRVAIVLASLNSPSPPSLRSGQVAAQVASQGAPRSPDADSVMRQLAQAVRGLTEDRDRIMTRLVAVEHNVDDMTGSISREIEAAKAATAQAAAPWPDAEPPVPMTPATIASATGVPPPVGGLATPLPPSPSALAAAQSPPDAAASDRPAAAYGADLGGASSVKALHARWATIRSAHTQIFAGLTPVAILRDSPRSNKIALRLVVGPFANAERAAQLCASLAAVQLSCQPTMFDGPHLELQ
jgi:hypothetical protein